MPFAIAVLHDPAGVYGFLVVAVAGLVHGALARRLVPAFTGAAAALLVALAFLATPPDPADPLLIVLGVALMNVEFRLATFGIAGVAGCAAAFAGSLGLLATAAPPGAAPDIGAVGLAGVGTLAWLLASYRAQRRRALPR